MAERIESFDFKRQSGGSRYPWEQWLDGSIWRLTERDDFNGAMPKHIGSQIRINANKRGLAVRVSIDAKNGVIVLQAYMPSANGQQTSENVQQQPQEQQPTEQPTAKRGRKQQ